MWKLLYLFNLIDIDSVDALKDNSQWNNNGVKLSSFKNNNDVFVGC